MSTETLVHVSTRIHPALRAQIWTQAKRLRLKPADLMRRHLEDAFSFDPEVANRDENDTDTIILPRAD